MRILHASLLAALSLASATAQAQIMSSPVQDYVNKTTLLNNILSNARATDMSQRAQTAGGSRSRAAGTAGSSASPTSFRHAGQSLMPAVLAQRSAGGGQQREAERFFESQLELYRRTATTDGFPPNELAYAMEYFVVNSYMIVHDLHDVPYEKDPRAKRGKDSFDRLTIISQKKALKPTLTQERAVYGQMQAVLAANPGVAKMSDREKQELTELLAIMFGVNYATYMRGVDAEDERVLAQARQTASENLQRILGVPAAQIKIDDNGVRQ